VLVVAGHGKRSKQAREAVASGLAAARQRGVRLGRPAAPPPPSGQRIEQLRAQGLSLAAIAAALNAEGAVSPSGRAWTKASVQWALRRLAQLGEASDA
jgi:DNA invertase Pin-like site-specific DNA recombinase